MKPAKNFLFFFVILVFILSVFLSFYLIYSKYYENQIVQNDVIQKIDEPKEIEPINNPELLAAMPALRGDENEVSILAVGDIMLSRSVETLMKSKNNWLLPFELTKNITAKVDIAFGNLETSIFSGRPIQTGEFAFRTDPKAVAGLEAAGFDLVSLANNHTPNFGQAGLQKTFEELQKAKIEFVGAGNNSAEAGQPIIIEKNGLRFGFLAYTYSLYVAPSYFAKENQAGVNPMDLEKMKNDVLALEPQVDFVIVSMHDGVEYEAQPTDEQEKFARTAIECGASLVLGSHPHVVQTMEKYQDGYIFYSLGNFVFDQLWSEQTRRGLAIKAIFDKKGIKQIQLLPIYINKDFQPLWAEKKDKEQILKRLEFEYGKTAELFFEDNEYEAKEILAISGNNLNQRTVYQSYDLNQDGKNEEVVVYKNVGYLLSDDKIIWRTDSDWEVENVLVGDFNNDKKTEFGFSLWKIGSYGPAKPFWVKENDLAVSNHLFLYQLDKDEVKMVWGSSALDYPIKEMALKDFNSDGNFDLIVWQSQCGRSEKNCLQNNLGVWRWNKFGFYNVFQSSTSDSYTIR